MKKSIGSNNVANIFFFFFVATLFLSSIQNVSENNENSLKISNSKTNDRLFDSQLIRWENNGTVICNANNTQYQHQIISDGAGGAIIVWLDIRNTLNFNIYAQRVDANGNGLWGANGTIICNSIEQQWSVQLVRDGASGAIIAWQDGRDLSVNDYDIYAQKINLNGIGLWGANGTVICNDTSEQKNPQIVSDGAGGAIIAWQDLRLENPEGDIYAQRVNAADGKGLWGANGTVICNATDEQMNLQLVGFGVGEAIIAWQDLRGGLGSDDIYAQRVNAADGKGLWGTNGTAICNSTYEQVSPQLIREGTDGAIITWQDNRNDEDYNIYAQKIDTSGNGLWGANGTVICNATENQSVPKIISNGAGASGAIITWQDKRNPVVTSDDIYAQKIDTSGNGLWGANGTIICNAKDHQYQPQLVSDGAGGAIITWQDWRNYFNSEEDIYAQKIDANGNGLWGANGTVICNAIEQQSSHLLVSDGAGGAIIVWEDWREAGSIPTDIYAQRISKPVQGVTFPIDGDDDDDNDEEEQVIPLGNYYLIPTIFGIVYLIILIYKRKLNLSKN